jgi:hypothetical protein
MKKLHFLALSVGLSAVMVLNSCNTTTPVVTPPLVTVNPTAAATAKPNDVLDYQMIISSDTDLKTAEMTAQLNSTVLYTKDSVFGAGTTAAIVNFSFTVPAAMADGAVITLTFTAKNDGEQTVATRTVNVANPPGEIYTYTAVIMSDLKNPEGKSFYSIEDNKLLNINEALASSSTVDLIYYYGSVNKATLCAPADVAVEVFENLQNESIVKKFTTRNNTKIAPVTMTVAEFDAVANDLTIKAKAPAVTSTAVATLAKDAIVWSETVAGKKALIKIVSITGVQATSFITIEVKVQK